MGIIVAQIGLGLGVMSNTLYGVVVFMAVATTLIAPPFLTILFKQTKNELANELVNHSVEVVDSDKKLSVIE